MDSVLRYMYLPVLLGGGWHSVWVALRLYLRYRMIPCFYSAEMRPLWQSLPWLCCQPLPPGCSAAVAVEALLRLSADSEAYVPLLFVSPYWASALSGEDKKTLESRYILCDEADVRRLSALFVTPRPIL